MHVLVFHEACVHQFAALFTIAAEAVFHIHVVDTQNKIPNNVTTDYPFHSSVAPSVPLYHVSVCHRTVNMLYNFLYGHGVLSTV